MAYILNIWLSGRILMNDLRINHTITKALKLQSSGEIDNAKSILKQFINIEPNNVAALYSLAVLLFNNNEAEKALPLINRAITLKPNVDYFYNTKMAILEALGLYEQAFLSNSRDRLPFNEQERSKLIEKILKNPVSVFINESSVNSLSDLVAICEAYVKEGQFEKAILLYRNYINSKAPDAFLARYNLGALYSTINEHYFSAACYEELTKTHPGFLPSHMNLATVYERLGRNKDAIVAWEKILSIPQIIAPENKIERIKVYNNLGRLNELEKFYEKAEQYLFESLKIEPSQAAPLQHWFHLRQKQFKWPILTDDEFCQKPIEEIMSPLASLAYTNDPALQRACAERFVREKVTHRVRRVAKHHRYFHDKIRIGYASSDLSTHAVSLLTVELFEFHDRSKFEVHAFCWSPEDGTPFRQRVKSAFDQFHPIGHLSDDEAADLIQSLEIDVLVDLQGLSGRARPNLISQGAAPVQFSYLGYPGTTGLPHVDYVIADRFIFPEDLKKHFSEEPLFLDTVFQVSDSKRKIGPEKPRSFYGIPDNKFVFCSFNNSYKYTPEIIGTWSEILARCSDSILWLLEDNKSSQENILAEFKKYNVAIDKIYFSGRIPPEDYLARFRCADLFLDTFPYNAGTTANDALFSGLPVLTLVGNTYVSRMAGSLNFALGLPQMNCRTNFEYQEKASKLANSKNDIQKIRDAIDIGKSNLFDIKCLVTEYEKRIKEIL